MLYAWRNGRIGIVSTFTLMLQDTTQSEQVDNVTSFVGEDDSGAFGILARHTRMMTILVAGLARFRGDDENWNYIATPGADKLGTALTISYTGRTIARDKR